MPSCSGTGFFAVTAGLLAGVAGLLSCSVTFGGPGLSRSEAIISDAEEPGGAVGFVGVERGSIAFTAGSGCGAFSTLGAAGSGCCSGVTSGCEVGSLAPPALRLFGPLALPLRMSCNGAPSAAGSPEAPLVGCGRSITPGLADLEGVLAPLFAGEGGPKDRILAKSGLKRAASPVGALCSISAGALICFSKTAILGCSSWGTLVCF